MPRSRGSTMEVLCRLCVSFALVGCTGLVDTDGVRPEQKLDAAADAFVRGCPFDYFGFGNGERCFRYFETPMTPAEAQSVCELEVWLEVPGHLAVLDPASVRLQVVDELAIEDATVGLYRVPGGSWRWITGEGLGDDDDDPDLNAELGEPGQDCVRMSKDGRLFPSSCASAGSFLCGWDFRTSIGGIPAP